MTNDTPTNMTFVLARYELTNRIRDELDGFMGDMQFDPAIDKDALVADIAADLRLWAQAEGPISRD